MVATELLFNILFYPHCSTCSSGLMHWTLVKSCPEDRTTNFLMGFVMVLNSITSERLITFNLLTILLWVEGLSSRLYSWETEAEISGPKYLLLGCPIWDARYLIFPTVSHYVPLHMLKAQLPLISFAVRVLSTSASQTPGNEEHTVTTCEQPGLSDLSSITQEL